MAIEKEIIINVKEKGFDKVEAKTKQLDTNLKASKGSNDNLNKSLDQTKGKGNVFGSATDGLTKMNPAIGGVIGSMKAMLVQMWAIVSNPLGLVIVAIVGSLTLLYKAFASTKEGAEKVDQIMAGLSATFDVLRDRVLKIGGALVKFFSGDLKGAAEDARASFTGIGDEIVGEFKKAEEATSSLQKIDDATRALGVSRAKLNRDLAEAKAIMVDENATYAEKKKAIDEVRIAEEAQTAAELKNAEEKLAAIKTLNALSDSSAEDLQKQADAEAALYELQTQSANNRKEIADQERTMDNEEAARKKSIYDEQVARIKEEEKAAEEKLKADEKLAEEEAEKKAEADQKIIDDHQAVVDALREIDELSEIEALQRKEDDTIAELERLNATEAEKQKIRDFYANKRAESEIANDLRIAAAKKAADKKDSDEKKALDKKVADSKIQLENQVFNIVGMLAKKGSKIGKAIAAGEAIRNTYLGVTAALSEKYTIPAPLSTILRFANAAAVGVAGFKNVKSILATKEEGSSDTGGGSSSLAAPPSATETTTTQTAATAATAPSFNLVGGANANQINTQPVQAYVVSGNVTTAQSLDRNIIEGASL